MKMSFIAEALDLTLSSARRLKERKVLRKAWIDHPFFPDIEQAYCLSKKFGKYEEGTLAAQINNEPVIVRGFPKIRRALTLYPTIKKRFKGEVVVEEKMNGYNVRIVKFGDNLYAVTRRGLVCPYSTEKAREKMNPDFFADNPQLMLCCEGVGEESPFVPKKIYGHSELEFYVFDIRNRGTNTALPVNKKEELAEEYNLNLVPLLGRMESREAHEEVKDIVIGLGKEGREGVVIKDPEMKRSPLKYTSSQSTCADLKYAFRYFNEYGKDYMFSRIIREAFQSFEFEESEEELEERCLRLGEAILKPVIESIRDVHHNRRVVEMNYPRFSNTDVLELFKEHLQRMGVEARFEDVTPQNEHYILHLERRMKSTTDKIDDILKGNVW
ncbi:MAG: RNA ligase [Halobacteriota archaeon]